MSCCGATMSWGKQVCACRTASPSSFSAPTSSTPPNWLVRSVDDAIELIVAAGGAVLARPTQIPVGRLAVVADPFANALVLLDLSSGRYVTDERGHVTGVTSSHRSGDSSGVPGLSKHWITGERL